MSFNNLERKLLYANKDLPLNITLKEDFVIILLFSF